MSLEVKIPPLGESIVSGILAAWHVADGDTVKSGQALFELETDKITSEGTAEADGVISLKVAEGDEVKIGQVVATIDSDAGASSDSSTPAAPAKSQPESEPESEPKSKAEPKSEAEPKSAAKAKSAAAPSPAVRRLAEESGIDPATVEGTGKAGRVTKGDMLKAADASTPEKSADTAPAATESKSESPSPKRLRDRRRCDGRN